MKLQRTRARAREKNSRRWIVGLALAFAFFVPFAANTQPLTGGALSSPWDTQPWLPTQGPIYLQIGAFASLENAERLAERLSALEPRITANPTGARTIYRVTIGPYANAEEARALFPRLQGFALGEPQVLQSLPEGVQDGPSPPIDEVLADELESDERAQGEAEESDGAEQAVAQETENAEAEPVVDESASAQDPDIVEPSAIPDGGPTYYLQVGAFGSQENAERLAETLSRFGSQVTANASGSRTIYRVTVGPFANAEEASAVSSQLAGEGLGEPQLLRDLPTGIGVASTPQAGEPGVVSNTVSEEISRIYEGDSPRDGPREHSAPETLAEIDQSADDGEPIPLHLMVLLNGEPTYLIAAFVQYPDYQIGATRAELLHLGIDIPGEDGDEVLRLDDISGLEYVYDEALQAIQLTVPDNLRVPTVINAKGKRISLDAQRNTGAYVNYAAFASAALQTPDGSTSFDLASLSFDGHLYGRFGTFSQSGILGTSQATSQKFVRLNSTWTYSDPYTARAYRAGDVISGGLAWTRPVRMGGLQIQRNFSIRPDLITIPLPSVSGSAVVPSTLDVYVGNLKTYSTELPSGPYQIDNLPVVSGSGTARIVLTDATGRQVESETSFFSDIRLLREGLLDYSLEAGFMRTQFGLGTGNYNEKPVLSGGVRYGLNNAITLEGHTEFGRGLALMGGGVNLSLGRLGLVSGSGAFSHRDEESGSLFYGSWYLPLGNLNLLASSRRTFGDYLDLASLPTTGIDPLAGGLGVARATDQVTIGYRFDKIRSSLSLSALHADYGDGTGAELFTGTFTSSFKNGMSIFANAVYDAREHRATAAFVGLSIPFGGSANASSAVTANENGLSIAAQVQKNIGTEPGSYGGRVAVSRGQHDIASATGAVRLHAGLLEGSLTHQSDSTHLFTTFSGSVVATGKGLYVAPQITDAFAVVDAAAPGIDVFLENRPMGATRGDGTLLVTGLNSFEENLISISPKNYPVNTEIPNTNMRVVPADRSGVVASFEVELANPSAVVIFTQPGGDFIEAGARGVLAGSEETFFVGYEGRAFIRNLQAENSVTIDAQSGMCTANFTYMEDLETQVTIGPVLCN